MVHVWEEDGQFYIVAISDDLEVKILEVSENISEKQSIESR
jgi:hypothetical protein